MLDRNGRRVYIHTWGCQLNEHKSEGIAGVLQQAGYRIVDELRDAQVVIFNTCTVREKAVDKVLGKISEVHRLRARGKKILLGIGGCLAQAEKGRLLARSGKIDFLFGTADADIRRLPRLIARGARGALGVGEPVGLDRLPTLRKSSIAAYVAITEGCDHFCSYCIIPYTRGRLRSRPMEEIVREVEGLGAQGYQEITLLGQNVNAYGADKWGAGRFPALLRRVAATGISRIRFTSSHPQDITEDLLSAIAEWPNICPQIHIAAQSGSNPVLKDMGRPYTREEFLEKVKLARRLIPDVNITSDLIVGYPTETEEDFQGTVELVERARFGSAFIFKFSPRPGTVAAVKYGDPIPDQVKQTRHGELLELQRRISEEESRKLIGRTVEVLVEGSSNGRLYGRSSDHRMVLLSGEEHLLGELIEVRVIGVARATLLGRAE